MYGKKSLLLVAGFVTLVSASTARADDYRQVWHDTEGTIVHNTYGNCVRSRWITDQDACAPGAIHTVIAQEDRTVYFVFNKAELTEEGKAHLNTLADKLMSADDVQGADIVGYADRIGTSSYNLALSKKRAEAVRSYLISRGFLKASVTKTRWVGKSEPTANCPKDLKKPALVDCLQPDRKVVVEIVYHTVVEKGPAPAQHPHHKAVKKQP